MAFYKDSADSLFFLSIQKLIHFVSKTICPEVAKTQIIISCSRAPKLHNTMHCDCQTLNYHFKRGKEPQFTFIKHSFISVSPTPASVHIWSEVSFPGLSKSYSSIYQTMALGNMRKCQFFIAGHWFHVAV